MIEITKEDLKLMPLGTMYLCYNPLTNTTKKETLNKNSIVFSKHCYEGLVFYIDKK